MRNILYITTLITGCFFCLFIGGCTPFSVPDRSADSQLELPQSFSLVDGAALPEQQWWSAFGSSQLDTLINEALGQNLSLQAYWARLEKAKALARKTGSSLLPSLSADSSASHTRSGGDDTGSADDSEYSSFSVGLFASYELDLWGRIRAQNYSAGLSLKASREDLNAAAMSIAAEVARRWIGILARQQELQLLRQQLETNRTYLELIELRFRKSQASALDVMQQRQLVERIRAQIPLAEMQEQLLKNELAVLTGRLPINLPELKQQPLPTLNLPPQSGLPAELLENRPDIRGALLRLEAADQNLVVAKADRLPAISLTGRAGYNSGEVETLFDNWLLNLAASLTAPLFDGGRRKAEVDASAAAVKEQLALYREVVLTAVREVEDSLTRETKYREHIARAEGQLEAARTALDEARSRYMNGLNDYLPVLTQLLSVQGLQKDLIARHEDILNARISLYRAIGGTWTADLPAPKSSE